MILTIWKPLAPVWYRTKVPRCCHLQPVTVLTLSQLNSSNGQTASIFQLLLIAQGCSGWRQQQLLTCCFVQAFEFGTWSTRESWLQKCSTFSSYFVLTPQQKLRTFFSYIRDESAYSAVQFTVPVFLGFIFHKTLELRGLEGFAIDEPPRGSVNEPVDHSQNYTFCCRLPTLYKLLCLLFECYDSPSVFTCYCIIMCNWHGVSSENLVVMQVHWGINLHFLL